MKKYLILSLTLLLCFAACKKQEPEPEQLPGLADDIIKAKSVIGNQCSTFESYLIERGYKKSPDSDNQTHEFIGEYCTIDISLKDFSMSTIAFNASYSSLDDVKVPHKIAHEQIYNGPYYSTVVGKEYSSAADYISRVSNLSKNECDSYEDIIKAFELSYDNKEILSIENSFGTDMYNSNTFRWSFAISNDRPK